MKLKITRKILFPALAVVAVVGSTSTFALTRPTEQPVKQVAKSSVSDTTTNTSEQPKIETTVTENIQPAPAEVETSGSTPAPEQARDTPLVVLALRSYGATDTDMRCTLDYYSWTRGKSLDDMSLDNLNWMAVSMPYAQTPLHYTSDCTIIPNN